MERWGSKSAPIRHQAIKLVDSEFNGNVTKRVEYKVIDVNRPAAGEKKFQMALSNARQINRILQRGRKLLEIERMDMTSKQDTIYQQ